MFKNKKRLKEISKELPAILSALQLLKAILVAMRESGVDEKRYNVSYTMIAVDKLTEKVQNFIIENCKSGWML
jgi:hypothetical protein